MHEALRNGRIKFILKIDKKDDKCLISHKDEIEMLLSIPLSRDKGKNRKRFKY